MANVKWIKIVTDVFDNRKIRQIELMPDSDAILVIWFKILCLAGTINESGMLLLTRDIPYNDEMLANQFNRPINTIRLALDTFRKFGMIETTNNILCVSNWEKYQNIETLDKIREQTRLRVAKHREQRKIANSEVCNVTVTQCNATEEDKKENKNKNKNKNKEPPCPLTEFGFSLPLQEKIEEWLTYKTEKKDTYKPTGFKSLMLKIQKQAAEYGDQAVMDLIDECMAANWKGIVWDKLQQRKNDRSGNPFKEALRKELEREQNRSNGNNDGYQGGLSKLLQEPGRGQ